MNIFHLQGQLPQHGVVEELAHAAKRVRLRFLYLTVEIEQDEFNRKAELWLGDQNAPDVLTHAFAPSRLHHELASERYWWLDLKGPKHDGFIERVTGNNGPVIEHRKRHGLPLSVAAQIRLKPKRLNDG
jgi:hypothetical protein